MGFSVNVFESLVKFRIFKVTPEFLGELKVAGLKDFDSEELEELERLKELERVVSKERCRHLDQEQRFNPR